MNQPVRTRVNQPVRTQVRAGHLGLASQATGKAKPPQNNTASSPNPFNKAIWLPKEMLSIPIGIM